ncbi:hypothetical protein PPL_10933 [Heterostelium album PN500]|uniref:Uncharacterized protein n=1 Tax=Heterostelium pallidum (strain ATCC 26659 / Pp 5 / PN500) TaxID=670386 RepID=D3BSG5_HETP5|nr:hypothetical protein PPL_10933 [Heterostelium album PN500]EFA75671.1 hypothetical protein PPL_10933 [Heterostelium album PN500]|eukprot:XP_020427805.1 hypothetical protein PPL_10933 [Heterostelium album PN500]
MSLLFSGFYENQLIFRAGFNINILIRNETGPCSFLLWLFDLKTLSSSGAQFLNAQDRNFLFYILIYKRFWIIKQRKKWTVFGFVEFLLLLFKNNLLNNLEEPVLAREERLRQRN